MIPNVAAIITEYRHNSHAEVIVGRLLGRLGYEPRVRIASMYVDQFPANDMSRMEAQRCGIPICPSIADAIAEAHRDGLGGIVIIGEHGDYSISENGQKCYPRRAFIEETLRVLDCLQVRVPLFSDKHLSWNINDAQWIAGEITKRGIPFLGGSSIPFVPSLPEIRASSLQNLAEILVVSFGDTEDYGFHALEIVQSLAEWRTAGEAGVDRVSAIRGDRVWEEMKAECWPEDLMHLALDTYPSQKPDHPMYRVKTPVLIKVNYSDGLKAYVLQLPGEVEQWSVAWRTTSDNRGAARYNSDQDRPFRHFETLTRMIEEMIISGRSPVPIRRTFLTTGMIHYAMESLHQGAVVHTPDLL